MAIDLHINITTGYFTSKKVSLVQKILIFSIQET